MILRLFYSKSDECKFEEENEAQSKIKTSSEPQIITQCSENDISIDSSEEPSSMYTQPEKCSELLMSEQLISECKKTVEGEEMSHLTFLQYEQMDIEDKMKIQNRVRQWVLKAWQFLLNDHGLFCLVVAHLLKNAHRYFNLKGPSEMQTKILENRSMSEETKQKVLENFKEANKKVREVCDLKKINCLVEQQELVTQLKEDFHSFRKMSLMSGISLKSVHTWCSWPKQKIHKSSQIANARKQEFKEFLLQDSISFEHPCKKYAGKRFLRDTLEVTRQKYLQQPEFHKHGISSLSSMKEYRPGYIMLCNKTPLDQCLCDKCENFEQLLKALKAVGLKSVPSNRYAAVDCVVCEDHCQQVGTNFTFPKQECIEGNCQNCGTAVLEGILCKENIDMVTQNRSITWHKWVTQTGKSAPEKCQIKGTI